MEALSKSPALRWSFTSTFTSCCATEEKSASAASGEQGVRAMTTTQARRAMGARAELESHLPLLELAGRAPARSSFSRGKCAIIEA
jgi:hypothetical protein